MQQMEEDKKKKEEAQNHPENFHDNQGYVNPFTDNNMNFEEDIDQDIEKWETDTGRDIENSLPKGWLKDSWKRLNTFRWLINAIVIGGPFAFFMIFADFWNIVLNIWWNNCIFCNAWGH